VLSIATFGSIAIEIAGYVNVRAFILIVVMDGSK
jgi:hypothetical protein